MSNIRKLKQPRAKSDNHVVSALLDALHEARHNRVISMALTMQVCDKKKTVTYTDYVLTPKSSYPECIGGLEKVKEKIMTRWKEHD